MSITTIANEQITVQVSTLGAEMQTIETVDGRQWLWNGDPIFWTGRSPVLFPIVGKAPGDTLTISGRSYAMAQHGFARRNEFRLVRADRLSCLHELSESEATLAIYPFRFRLELEHRLDSTCLSVVATVRNVDTSPMPFGFGFHPALRWPMPGMEQKRHFVRLPDNCEPLLTRLESGLLQPTTRPSPFQAGRLELHHTLFAEDAMIFRNGAGSGLCYGAEGGPEVEFRFEGLPDLALWSKPQAPFICIEPWHGTAAMADQGSDIRNRPGTMELSPGEDRSFSYSMDFGAVFSK